VKKKYAKIVPLKMEKRSMKSWWLEVYKVRGCEAKAGKLL
jgi:hypothetical protein